MNIAFLVSTTKSYYKESAERVILELQNSGVPATDLFVISSQEDSCSSELYLNSKVIKVTYTGIHLTPLIYVYDNLLEFKKYTHFCLLHATSKFGLNFYTKLINHLTNIKRPIDGLPFNNDNGHERTKDMGILSYDQLKSLKNYLNHIKLETYTADSLLSLKTELIFYENLIFGLPPVCGHNQFKPIDLGRTLIAHKGIEDASNLIIKDIKLNTEVLRETFFPSLDFYKYQRTFQGFNNISMNSNGSIPK